MLMERGRSVDFIQRPDYAFCGIHTCYDDGY